MYALITGGSSGIGLATAKALAREGRNIILVARNAKKLEVAAADIKSECNVDVLTFDVDLQKNEEIEQMFEDITDREIDVVVNNAGLALGKESFEDLHWNDLETMIDTNVIGLLRVTQLAIPFLKISKGHIVNVSSIAGLEAYEGGSVYCASKAFVRMMSKSLRIDLAGTGIQVTDIAPGKVETNFSVVRFKGDTKEAGKEYVGYAPLRAEDIADCIAFAVSRPDHVNIDTMLVMPTAQASACRIVKD